MKTKIFLISGFLLLSFFGESQKKTSNAVMLKIDNLENLPVKSGAKLKSKDLILNSILSKHKVVKIDYPFSNSRNQELKSVIQLTCNCDAQMLYADLVNKSKASNGVALAPSYETLETPDDYSIAFTNDYALNLINAQAAWDLTQGNPSVVLGISDQNFDMNHEELSGKVLYYDPNNTSTKTHGTAVAITAAGNTDNAQGKASIGFNSSLKLYRMNYNEVLAASYAGVKVVNMSWTSGCSYNAYVQQAIDEVWANGTFLVASAGNGTTCSGASNLVYPAAYNHVFAVTSIGPNNNHERIVGDPSSTHQHNASVDICAPGYDVAISAAPGWYFTSSGTSYAAPLVTGTVGLMLAVNPCLTNVEIETILKQSATNIDSYNPQYAGLLGAGKLNAQVAVQMAMGSGNLQIVSLVDNTVCTPNSGEIEIINALMDTTHTYTYLWSNGSTESFIDSLANGNYSVIVSNGCATDTANFTINTQPTNITAQITYASSAMSPSGSINIDVYGIPLFTYLWNDGSTNEDLVNVPPGHYTVIVTNGFGCSSSASYYVGYNQVLPFKGNRQF